MRTVRTSDNNVLVNTSWTELNGYKELISDVYYYNYREGKYEFICHHQRPVARRRMHYVTTIMDIQMITVLQSAITSTKNLNT